MQLNPYQIDGIKWLLERKHALLADDMGLGKTVQAITAARLLKYDKINIICPALVRGVWAEEIAKWWPQDCPTVRIVKPVDAIPSTSIAICSYETLLNPSKVKALCARKADLTIFDESHYLKNDRTQRTIAAYGKKAKGLDCVGASSTRVWCLSGTPAPNDPSELWPMLRFFGVFPGSRQEFLDKYLLWRPSDYGVQVVGIRDAEGLVQLIKGCILRRRMSEVKSQMAPLTTSTVSLPGDYHGELAFLKELPPEVSRRVAIALAADDWRLDDVRNLATIQRCIGLAKMPAAAELINYELRYGMENCIIFAQHTQVIEGLRAKIKGARAIMGNTAQHHRQTFLAEFAEGKTKCLILNINMAREGLRFKNCRNVVLLEPLWSPELNNQAIRRLDWIGREHPVQARFISLAGSIDEVISRVLARKASTLSKVLA